MIVGRFCLSPRPRRSTNWMSVVEANQALIIRPVQGQRIIQTMRPFRRDRHAPHFDLHPVAAFLVDYEDLPIEVEKRIQACIAFARGYLLLQVITY